MSCAEVHCHRISLSGSGVGVGGWLPRATHFFLRWHTGSGRPENPKCERRSWSQGHGQPQGHHAKRHQKLQKLMRFGKWRTFTENHFSWMKVTSFKNALLDVLGQ